MAGLGPPRRRMIEDMAVRNLSPATRRSCVDAVSTFGRVFGRSPDRLTPEDVAWPGLDQTAAALRFFCGVTLGMAEGPGRIASAREPRRLPVVPGAGEVVRFLEAVPSPKARAAQAVASAALTIPVAPDHARYSSHGAGPTAASFNPASVRRRQPP